MIKKLIVIAAAGAVLLSCNSKQTVFNGKIEGYNGEFTEFFLPDSTVEGGYREIVIDVNEDGTFSSKFTLPESQYHAALFVDRVMFSTCIEQGKTYNAWFNVTDPSVETDFRFIGEGAAENEFTRDWWNGFGAAYLFLESCGDDVTDFKSYRALIDSQAAGFAERLDTIGNPGLKEYYTPLIRQCVDSYSFYYPFVAVHNGTDPFADADFEAYRQTDACAEMTEQEFAEFYNGVAGMIAATFNDLDLLQVVKIGEQTTPDQNRNEFAMTSLLTSFMNMAGQNNLKAAYDYYKKVCKTPGYVSQVENVYKTSSVLVKGAEAPEIEFTDIDGKTYTLSDFKGKALYVDMWASWCGPCCEEIPYLAELYEEIGPDSDIQCISISIDEGRQDWLDKLAEENPAWPQYLVTGKGQEQVANDYNIRSIPRFMLFDAQGRIITVDAPRPSTPDIKAILEELIK